MKNPNGFGSLHKLKGNRRNPWRARMTIGWDENGKHLYQTIGYYKTRQLGLQALAEYNANPYDIRMKSLFNLMYKYALKHEICDKYYAALYNSVKKAKPTIERIPFPNDEVQILWDNIDFPFVSMIFIGIYSGWRP